MNTRIRRLKRLETQLKVNTGDTQTLEEACRMRWRLDKQSFIQTTDRFPFLLPLVRQFEYEDRERERRLDRR